jgi:hypothetical protein
MVHDLTEGDAGEPAFPGEDGNDAADPAQSASIVRWRPAAADAGDDLMTRLWLWDAEGPGGSASGVAGDDGAARRAAGEGMAATGAAVATVEEAAHFGGGGWMRSGYSRTGTGWTARRSGSRIRWTRFHRPELAAS